MLHLSIYLFMYPLCVLENFVESTQIDDLKYHLLKINFNRINNNSLSDPCRAQINGAAATNEILRRHGVLEIDAALRVLLINLLYFRRFK